MNDDQELNELGTVDEGFGTDNQTTPATGTEDERQPQDQAAGKTPDAAKAPVTAEDFKKYQANFDRRYEAARKEAEQARQEAQRVQQQFAQVQQQLYQQQLQSLPEEQRPHFENQALRQQLNDIYQRQQFDNVKNAAMRTMQSEAQELGIAVTLEELAQQPNADDAWRFVLRKGAETWKQPSMSRQARAEKADANSVDLGGGAPVTPVSELQAKYNKAKKNFDGFALTTALYEAAAAGLTLEL